MIYVQALGVPLAFIGAIYIAAKWRWNRDNKGGENDPR